ncbi:MAG: hypothetical protein DMF89_18620 [Acidobacteria bacterium]|nr:MAG: hypothetical protein DMF89_18620 [Acidobacteriota bacterium]
MNWTIDQFARKLRARQVSALEVTDDCLRQIAADNGRLNAFTLVLADEARQQAREADRELAAGFDRGPLQGVPLSIKDLIDVNGTPTTAASRVREGHVARHDAAAVSRLRAAGAVLVGKTNLHEFAFGTTNEESAFGPARNPHDPTRSPGGSSGGSAASVAAGMALASLGTDTGGSIRIPAAACGTVGLKPTFDELPTDGVIPLSRTMDHLGPLAKTVTDTWYVFRALHGGTHPKLPEAQPARHLRLAIPRPYFCDLLDDSVRSRFDAAVTALRAAGASINDTELRRTDLIAPAYLHIVFGDAAAYHGPTLDAVPDRYTRPVRLRLEMARYVLAEDYVRALQVRQWLRHEVDVALRGYDALLLPTLPIPAPSLGAASVRIGTRDEPVRNVMLRLTQLFNLTGHPAISIPCGVTEEGLPCGLQLVGTRMQADTLLYVARAVENTLDES